jgi:general secretion pathway protein D
MYVGYQRSYISGATVSGDTPDPTMSTIMSGVVLDVRPIVSYNRHYITLELRPTIAEEGTPDTTNVTFTTTVGDPPVTTVNVVPVETPSLALIKVRTTVTIPDGGIILIGGLMQDIQYKAENGIPFFSNIPILGRLFRWNRTDNERKNLAVLVTARSLLFEEEEENL